MPGSARSLKYVSDGVPGIRRYRRKGRKVSFFYKTPSGRPLRDAATLARINALAVPPAYEDVWICPDPRGHLQATGRDARGRKQYRYHPLWRESKDNIKHGRMEQFGRDLPKLRRILRADLRRAGLPRDKVLALVISLIDATSVRIGNAEYARSNGSFGLSTLLDRHAHFTHNGTATLHFPGKGGAVHDVSIDDRKLATLVRKCQHLPGQHLFQYVDDEGRHHSIDSAQINEYLHRHLGSDFTAKDFRTWHATLRAYELLLRTPRAEVRTERDCRSAQKKVIEEVAAELRNTPAVCRKSYINPLVLTAWQESRGPFRTGHRGRGTAGLLSLLRKSPGVHP
jgi:DNA topoisomerase-1